MRNKINIHKTDSRYLPKIISRLSLSIFLAYMVVIWTIYGNIQITIFYFVVFSILFYYLVSNKILYYSYTIAKCGTWNGRGKQRDTDMGPIPYFFVPSAILGIGSVILLTLTTYYLKLSERFSLSQKFWDYRAIADKMPSRIGYFLLTSVILLFLIQLYSALKSKQAKKMEKISLSFNLTIIFLSLCMLAVFVGIIVYYIGHFWGILP